MYSFSEDEGYSFTCTTTTETYSSQTQTFQHTTTTTTDVQWEYTPNGYSHVKASDALFKDDTDQNTRNATLPRPAEVETEYQKCHTSYIPSKPVEKPSRSAEYVPPHKRYEGYGQTHNYKGRSNIRGHTISSSGDSSRRAQSRSQSRQRQYHQVPPSHRRSASRSSYYSNSAAAPAISRERTHQRRPQMMNVTANRIANQTRRPTTRQTSTTRNQTNTRRRRLQAAPAAPTHCTEVRKVRGKWIKGHVEPKRNICFQFLHNGTCSYGDRCKFDHVAKKKTNSSRRHGQQPTKYTYSNNKKKQESTTTTTSFVSRNPFVLTNGREW